MEHKKPNIVCWRITSYCNRHCPFCFRPNSKNLDTKNIFKIIDRLKESGITGMGITGGEPLSRPDISEIFKYLNNKGIKICLATNTDYYSKHHQVINDCVSTIGIPIEGSTKEVHDKVRGNGNFNNVIDTIKDIYKNSKIKMYFSTVLTQDNVDDLNNIESLLANYKNRIAYWKVYEVINYFKAPFQSLNQMKDTSESDKELKNVGEKIGLDKFFYSSSIDRSGASFLINPDGNAIVPIETNRKTQDVILGNILNNDIINIYKKWGEHIDFEKYQCHQCALKSDCNLNIS